jgi:hypothetical protein
MTQKHDARGQNTNKIMPIPGFEPGTSGFVVFSLIGSDHEARGPGFKSRQGHLFV